MSHLLALFCLCFMLISVCVLLSSYARLSQASDVNIATGRINNLTDNTADTGALLNQSSPLTKEETAHYVALLDRIRTLVRANVVNLAEKLLIDEAPPKQPTSIWFQWQQQLWALYKSTQQWEKLLRSSDQVPASFPEKMVLAGIDAKVTAQIALARYQQARKIIRIQVLINSQTGQSVQKLRQQLIESYLKEGRFDDANTAMQLYDIEYRENDVDWFRIKARLLIEQAQYDAALKALAPYRDKMSDLIKIHARSLNGSLSLDAVKARLNDYMASDSPISIRQYAHEVNIEAAQASNQLNPAILAVEEYLSFLLQDKAVSIAANKVIKNKTQQLLAQLLEYYRLRSEQVANDNGLLLDDYSRLYKVMNGSKFDLVDKRAVYANILRLSQLLDLQRQASDAYIEALVKDNKTNLVPLLFDNNNVFSLFHVKPKTQLALVNQALKNENYALAAFVVNHTKQTPKGVDKALWQLQNARIAILNYQLDNAKIYLDKWFDEKAFISSAQADQVVQPLFDLQKIQQHELAIHYFKRLLSKVSSPRHEREVAFWLAESYQATEQFAKAADYFLSSAMMRENGFDQWGEAARFKAAENLMQMGLYQDARNLFETLLARTSHVQRQNQLKQKIQELQLLQSTHEKNNTL